MKKILLGALLLASTAVRATPTTTFWAPSTTAVQPFLTPHITYDTYFWGGTTAGQAGSPVYPITTGLTMGVLPWENLQLEVGFDALLPSSDPFLFNAKLGVPEDKLFSFQPSLAVGIFGVGTKGSSVGSPGTDYNILYAQVQHTIPNVGGYISAGGYYGAGSEVLFTGSDGSVVRAGFMGGFMSPDININLPWLLKMNVTADVQTGKNVFGAAGGGLYFYFTDKIDLLTGPVYFFDSGVQPGGKTWFWTVQLDVDLPLRPAPPAVATAAEPPKAPATPPASAPAAASNAETK